ncbi:metal-sensing transcriptional repressor [Patescibacteria group bacterium]|nr:metal-sensing transcriptional repressor [Patescibacteria group bacterium]
MTENKKKALIGIKKSKSVLEKLINMIEEDKYCIDVMQQNLAAIGLLKAANEQLMEGHLNSCFKNAMNSKNDKKKQAMINEILKVSKLSNK